MSQQYRIPSRSFATFFLTFLFFLAVSTIVLAQQSDGRINQIAHFGGDALYCLDRNYSPTVQYPSSEGGFRLLNRTGQELWFVPYTDVAAALDVATPGGNPVLVATGWGTYGANELYTYEVGRNDVYFTFTGFDEHGKSNSLTFKFCIPVYGASQPRANLSVAPTSVSPTNVPPTSIPPTSIPPTSEPPISTPEVTETPETLMCWDDWIEENIPCSECERGWYNEETLWCDHDY